MEVTEVRVKLCESSEDGLRGFCSITLDGVFVVRDIKIIEGPNGVFVAMPSRKVTDACPKCRCKNHLRARFCNQCGAPLSVNRNGMEEDGWTKLHCDVAHPINAACRAMVQQAIVKAYREEMERAKQPGYVARRVEDVD